MKSYHSAQISGLALIALLVGAPSLAAQEQTNDQQMQSQRNQSQPGMQAFNRIRVMAGTELVGKPVRDREGMLVGEVEYLLINPINGKVSNVVVGPGETLNNEFRMDGMRAIPWDQFAKDFSNTGDIRTLALQLSRSELEQAPMVSGNAIEELTSPQYQALVRDYYLPIRPGSGAQSSMNDEQGAQTGSLSNPQSSTRGQNDQASAQQDMEWDQPTSNMEALDDRGQTGTQSGTSPEQSNSQANRQSSDMEALEQSGQAGTQSGPTSEQSAEASDQARSQQGSSSRPSGYVLLGRSIVTTLMPPNFRLAAQLQGANVVSADRRDLGEIERLMIDVDRGQVAYVLISQGGFLGSGETLRPVPLQALQWQGGETFRLNVNAGNFSRLPRINADDMPERVGRSDLTRLYRAFGVQPYWRAS